jgi:tetratricopeptide (TPR) repeat protein
MQNGTEHKHPRDRQVGLRAERFRMAETLVTFSFRKWFLGLFEPGVEAFLVPLLLHLYASYGSGELVTKSSAMNYMRIRDPRTANRYTQLAEKAGLLRIVQSASDQRVDYLIPTERLLFLMDDELDLSTAMFMTALNVRNAQRTLSIEIKKKLGEPVGIAKASKVRRELAMRSEAITLFPDNAAAYNGRALAYWDLGEAAKALDDCKRANELDPGNPEYVELLALMHQKLNDIRAARDTFKLLVQVAPSPGAFAVRARFFYEQQQFQEAVDDLSRAIELEQQGERSKHDLVLYFFFRAEGLKKLQKHKDAEADLLCASQIDVRFLELLSRQESWEL